jgi:DNA polymerase-3 subunit beta
MFDVVVNARDLREALKFVKGAVAARPRIPILNHVALAAAGDRLSIRAHNLDMEVTQSIAADVKLGGECCIPHKRLLAFVSGLPAEGHVRIWVGEEASPLLAHVECSGAAAALETMPAHEFPEPIDDTTGARPFALGCQTLQKALAFAKHCVSTDETRYYLNGVNVEQEGRSLLFVATDGYRMACHGASDSALNLSADDKLPSAIIPSMACDAILSMYDRRGDYVANFLLSDKAVRVSIGSRRVTSKLIDGTFPAWRRIGAKALRTFPLDRLATLKAVEALAKMKAGERAIGVKFHFGRDGLKINSGDAQAAPIAGDFGEPAVVGLNALYMAGILRQFSGPMVYMEVPDLNVDFIGPCRLSESAERPYVLLALMRT